MNKEKDLYSRRKLSREEEMKRDALYKELGQAYYEGAYEDPLPQLLPLFDQLTALMKEPEPEPEPAGPACPSCGAALPEGAVFCEECGCRVADPEPPAPARPQILRCPRCGHPLGEGARFCGSCGTKLF